MTAHHTTLSVGEREMDDAQLARFQFVAEPAKLQDLSSTIEELLGIVRTGLKRTQTLVADLRDFAAPGRQASQAANVDVEKGIRSTVHLMSSAMSAANAEVDKYLAIAPKLSDGLLDRFGVL